MSEQILRNPKSINRGGSYVSSKHDIKDNLSSMGLTRIKNPLTSRFPSKQEKNFAYQVIKSSKENFNKNIQPSLQQQRPLKQPEYKFYNDRFNASSDDSFVLDASMRESRKHKREQQIVERFQNSRKEIQQLLKRSRQRREQVGGVIAFENQKSKETKSSVKKMDKKQEKRKKLKFYHCDSIIIKPEFHPTKVFQLSIAPTTHNQNPARFSFFPHNRQNEAPQQQADLSFQSNSKYESVRKSKNKRFLDSFDESPLDKLNESRHHIELQSPSFLDINKKRSQSKYGEQSFMKDNSHEKKKIFFKKIGQHDYIDNDNFQNKQSRSTTEQQGKSNATNNFEKSSQQTIPTHSFKKRKKIFASEKKLGLKLSRTIRYQEEINKLQGEMGVDMFHIVIQEEELLRHCCT